MSKLQSYLGVGGCAMNEYYDNALRPSRPDFGETQIRSVEEMEIGKTYKGNVFSPFTLIGFVGERSALVLIHGMSEREYSDILSLADMGVIPYSFRKVWNKNNWIWEIDFESLIED